MKILFVCDSEYKDKLYEKFKQSYLTAAKGIGHEVNIIEIKKDDYKYCTGCFSCWVKTPGKCITKDKSRYFNEINMKSELVIYLTPIVYGCYSANIKSQLDKNIPTILPFFKKINNETHHNTRYSKYPNLIFVGFSNDITEKEMNTFYNLTKRNSINFHSKSTHTYIVKDKKSFTEINNELQNMLL